MFDLTHGILFFLIGCSMTLIGFFIAFLVINYNLSKEYKKELTGYSLEQTGKWDSNTKVSHGKKYIKVVQENGVFCFIVKEDFKHFKKGDILKAAGYNAPALNSARGNVLTGNYAIQWTGPLYLK